LRPFSEASIEYPVVRVRPANLHASIANAIGPKYPSVLAVGATPAALLCHVWLRTCSKLHDLPRFGHYRHYGKLTDYQAQRNPLRSPSLPTGTCSDLQELHALLGFR
jgi:hypothetical protein